MSCPYRANSRHLCCHERRSPPRRLAALLLSRKTLVAGRRVLARDDSVKARGFHRKRDPSASLRVTTLAGLSKAKRRGQAIRDGHDMSCPYRANSRHLCCHERRSPPKRLAALILSRKTLAAGRRKIQKQTRPPFFSFRAGPFPLFTIEISESPSEAGSQPFRAQWCRQYQTAEIREHALPLNWKEY